MTADAPESAEPILPAERLVKLLQWASEERGMNQAQVARQANVPSQYISDVRNQRRPMTELFARRLADEFNYNYLYLLGLADSPERPGLSVPPSPKATVWLPMLDAAIAGEPREHPRWSGAYTELSGIAAAQAARAEKPFILQLTHGDREGRLRKGDLLLISQATAGTPELCIVRWGKQILLARKKGTKWLRVATGEVLRGDCEVTGHCLGVVWSALM